MKAIWHNTIIAESDATIIVENNHYFPLDSVKQEYLSQSDTTPVCGWKGTSHYYHIVVDGNTNRDAAWYYPSPKEKAKNITGYIAFWKSVEVC